MVNQNIAWWHEATDPFQKKKKNAEMWFCCLSCSLFQLSQTYVAFIGYFFSSLTAAFNFLYSTHTSYHMPMYLLLIYGQFKYNDIIINHQKGQQLGQKFLRCSKYQFYAFENLKSEHSDCPCYRAFQSKLN